MRICKTPGCKGLPRGARHYCEYCRARQGALKREAVRNEVAILKAFTEGIPVANLVRNGLRTLMRDARGFTKEVQELVVEGVISPTNAMRLKPTHDQLLQVLAVLEQEQR